MANYFVDDSATGGADDGTSWSDAHVSLASVTPTSAGDICYIASTHDESISSDIVLDSGTASSPVWLISATAGSDPVTYAKGATIQGITYSADIEAGTNDYVVFWGVNQVTSTASGSDLPLGRGTDSVHYYIDCNFTANDRIYLGTSTDSHAKHTSCSYTINGASGWRELYQSGTRGTVDVRDGAVSGSVKAYAVHLEAGSGTTLRACDLSDFSYGAKNTSTSNNSVAARIGGCSVAAGFAPSETAYTSKPGNFVQADYCGTGTLGASDTVNGFTGATDYYGQTVFDSSRYRDDGAKDSLTGDNYSHAVTGRHGTLAEGHNSCELVARVDGGSSITITLHLAGSATLYNDEVWFDFFGPSDTTSARQHFATTRKANPLAAQVELTADTESWTGSDVGTKCKIAYTYTPHHSGLVSVIPVYAKGSGTIFICPKLTIE